MTTPTIPCLNINKKNTGFKPNGTQCSPTAPSHESVKYFSAQNVLNKSHSTNLANMVSDSTSTNRLISGGSTYPIINHRINKDDVLIQNSRRKESYWVPKGVATEAATAVALDKSSISKTSENKIKAKLPGQPDDETHPQEYPLLLITQNRKTIKATAKKYNIDPKTIANIIFQEKFHGKFAEMKNAIAYVIDGGINDKTPSTRSYGLCETQLKLAGTLLGIDPNSKGGKRKIYDAIQNDSTAIDIVGKNIAQAEKTLNRKLSPKGASILHNAGMKGLKSYLAGDKMKGGVYSRPDKWQESIEDALKGIITIPNRWSFCNDITNGCK